MALQKFDLAALANLDEGRVRETFDQALHRLEADCRDRPTLKRPRKVTLEVAIVPQTDEQGNLLQVLMQADVKESVPKRTTNVYRMLAGRTGLFVNELSPDDPAQMTLDMAPAPKPAHNPQPPQIRKDVTDAG